MVEENKELHSLYVKDVGVEDPTRRKYLTTKF